MHYLDSIGYTVVCFHGKMASQGLRFGPFLAIPFDSLLESARPLPSTPPRVKASTTTIESKGNNSALYQPTTRSSVPLDLRSSPGASKVARRRTKSDSEPVNIPTKSSSSKGKTRSQMSTSVEASSLVIKPSSLVRPPRVLKRNKGMRGKIWIYALELTIIPFRTQTTGKIAAYPMWKSLLKCTQNLKSNQWQAISTGEYRYLSTCHKKVLLRRTSKEKKSC